MPISKNIELVASIIFLTLALYNSPITGSFLSSSTIISDNLPLSFMPILNVLFLLSTKISRIYTSLLSTII